MAVDRSSHSHSEPRFMTVKGAAAYCSLSESSLRERSRQAVLMSTDRDRGGCSSIGTNLRALILSSTSTPRAGRGRCRTDERGAGETFTGACRDSGHENGERR